MCKKVVLLWQILPYSVEWHIETVLSLLIMGTLLELILRYVTMYSLYYWKKWKKNQLIFPASQAFLANHIKLTEYC